MPCHPARARELLRKGRAAVARQAPFAIRLKDRTLADSEVDGVQLRIDPGSKGTGLVLTDEKKEPTEDGATVTVRRGLVSVELHHRGAQIHSCMQQRASYRHRRRSANCHYRTPRSQNRVRPKGWLPPSLRHRVDTIFSIANRLCRYAPVTDIHLERTAFDTHSMSAGKPLYGAEYAQGPLAGTTTRSYLHAMWDSACAYCGATGVPLNIEHVRPRSRRGSNRISNLVLNRPAVAAHTPAPRRIGTDSPGCGGPVRSSTSGTSPETWYALSCLPASGQVLGPAVSPSGPGASTASPPRSAGSTSLTGIYDCCSGATGTATASVRKPFHQHLRKTVEPVSAAS
ncbi:RNA-guided endonuclease IscB [Streptomyces sp. NPDC001450]